jgi:hypothetical protein
METNDGRAEKDREDREAPQRRKPYAPPTIESEEEFERRALGCNMKPTGSPACMVSPSS